MSFKIAIKLLNHKGEFISAKDGQDVLDLAESEKFSFAEVDSLGSSTKKANAIYEHISQVLDLDLVNPEIIREKGYKIVYSDGIQWQN